MSNLTHDQLNDLRKEFVEFKINEMSHEDMYAYIRDIMMYDARTLSDNELKGEIDEYDENLYEVLEDYVTGTVGSYTALQEFIHDRHANDWIES